MIDVNQDDRIEYDEFLSAAKDALEDEANASRRSSTSVQEVLQKVGVGTTSERCARGWCCRMWVLALHYRAVC